MVKQSSTPTRVAPGVKCGCTHASTHTHMHTHLAISAGAKAAENTEVAWLKGKQRLWRRRQQIVRCRCWSVHLMSWCVCIYCARAWSEICGAESRRSNCGLKVHTRIERILCNPRGPNSIFFGYATVVETWELQAWGLGAWEQALSTHTQPQQKCSYQHVTGHGNRHTDVDI